MKFYHTKVVVDHIEGSCPYFKEGDSFRIERSGIIADESTSLKGICFWAITAMSPYLTVMTRGAWDKKEDYVMCPDPGPRFGGLASVRFKLIKGEEEHYD